MALGSVCLKISSIANIITISILINIRSIIRIQKSMTNNTYFCDYHCYHYYL